MQTGQHIFLIGFMGSGKSFWGQRLAARLHWPFIDLDEQIEQQAGKSIAEIFTEWGEDGFRKLEQKTLHRLATQPGTVVATGGGTPCFFDNLAWMNAHGLSIYLKAPPTLLANRLQHERSLRPLLKAVKSTDLQSFIENKLAEREPFYYLAHWICDQDQDAPEFLETLTARVLKHISST